MPQADSKNSSGQEQQHTAQTNPYPFPYPQQFKDDTIDLYELLITLWNRKWLVIAVTVVAALGSVVYVYALQETEPPVIDYKVEALLLAPTEKDIESLLKIKYNLDDLNVHIPVSVLTEFKKILTSRINQNNFFKKQGLIEYLATELNPETSVENFHQIISNLSVIFEEVNNTESRISISTKFKIPINFTKWLNSYIEFVEIQTIRELVEQIRNTIQEKITSINENIISYQISQNMFMRNRILILEEAAQIALELGIKESIDNNFSSPLYYRGYIALNVEIEFLKKRSWDLPYVNEILELEKERTRLSSIEIMEEDLQFMNIERAAYQTKTISSTNKKNKKRTIALSIVLGLLSGIFLAFFIEFVQNQRKKHSE